MVGNLEHTCTGHCEFGTFWGTKHLGQSGLWPEIRANQKEVVSGARFNLHQSPTSGSGSRNCRESGTRDEGI